MNNKKNKFEKKYLLKKSTFISKVTSESVHLLIRGNEEVEIMGDPNVILDFINLLKENITVNNLINIMSQRHGILKNDCLEVLNILISSNLVFEFKSTNENISNINLDRFSRQLSYFSMFNDNTAQVEEQFNRLLDAKVTLIGMGGLGAPIADLLVRSGIQNLRLIDGDIIELSNLNRQTLYLEQDVGKLKVKIAAKKLRSINSQVEIEMIIKELKNEEDIQNVIKGSDIVIVSADTPRGKMPFWVNDACIKQEIPVIFTCYIGDFGIVGPLIVPEETYCLRCGTDINEQSRFMHNVPSNILQKVDQFDSAFQPPSIGPICCLISSIAAHDVIKYLSQVSQPKSLNTILSINTTTLDIIKEPLESYNKCYCSLKGVIPDEGQSCEEEANKAW